MSRDSIVNQFTRTTRKQRTEVQYQIQRGVALEALKVKSTGKPLKDGGGRPFYYANQEAGGYSFKELEQRAKGRSVRSFSMLEDTVQGVEAPERFEETGRKRYIAEGGRWVRVE